MNDQRLNSLLTVERRLVTMYNIHCCAESAESSHAIQLLYSNGRSNGDGGGIQKVLMIDSVGMVVRLRLTRARCICSQRVS